MGWFSKKYQILTDDGKIISVTYEEKIQDLWKDFLEGYTDCVAILPEEEVKRQDPLGRAAATSILGFQGFALTEESTQYKSLSGTIRPATKGLVVAGHKHRAVRDKELRIPWESLVSATKVQKNFSLQLIDGTSIKIESGTSLKRFEEFRNMVIDYINSKACGVVEEGWD